MIQEEIEDLKNKKYILDNIDKENQLHLEFVHIMLFKGLGFTPTMLSSNDGIRKAFGDKKDFQYCCEIGKLFESYNISSKYDLIETQVLKLEDELFKSQILVCAENILGRLNFAMNVMRKAEEGEINEEIIIKTKKRVEECRKMLNLQGEY